jgi:hypothetical protein
MAGHGVARQLIVHVTEPSAVRHGRDVERAGQPDMDAFR